VCAEEAGVTASVAWAFESVTPTTPVFAETVADVADDVTYDSVTTTASTAVATTSAAGEAVASVVATDVVTAVDSVFGVEDLFEENVASCTDEYEVVILNSLVLETAIASGEPLLGTTGATDVSSVGVTASAVFVSVEASHTDNSSAYGDVDAETGVDATDLARAESDLLASVVSSGMLFETIGAFSELITTRDAMAFEEGFAVADDRVMFSRPDLTAWVMNTETGGVSWYSNWGFTDMATLSSGRTLAVGPDGLMLLGGNSDDGEKINASVVFDRTDFGGYGRDGRPLPDEPKKRIAGVYAGYRSTGELEVTLESWGPQYGAHKYRMQTHAFENHRNARVTPGKGLVSRYWKLSLGNVDGCNFDIVSLSADLASSKRRI
jgi:hypothetical protein